MIVLMPVMILGMDYGASFFSNIWYVVLMFVAVIGAVDAYFIVNWKLFRLLEEERWDDLITYLEQKIDRGKVPGKFIVRILINAYLSRSNLEGIVKLGELVREKKSSLYRNMLLLFSIPVLLKGDPVSIEEFIAPYISDKKVADRLWLRYLLSFALLLQKKNGEGTEYLSQLCREKVSSVLLLLVLYSYSPYVENEEEKNCIEEKKSYLKNKYSREAMGLQIERERSNVIVAVLSGVVTEAAEWLYEERKIEIKEQ